MKSTFELLVLTLDQGYAIQKTEKDLAEALERQVAELREAITTKYNLLRRIIKLSTLENKQVIYQELKEKLEKHPQKSPRWKKNLKK
ncbi:hypothetical protein DSO57_1031241 [Entomophthora muscae]|uniref:Uncharacterized protein n=1 Tax=Entomophthora muscae TaxID=34485 RepID=A0ACC2T0R7_9FUNG|nr:hypothetical protein DSO57_1031241 [Entomophthora muscae]